MGRPFKKPEDKLREDLDTLDFHSILLKMTTPKSHFFDHDSDKKPEEMLDIVARRDKNAQSNFADSNWVENILSEAMYSKAKDIYDNIRKRPYDDRFAFRVDAEFENEVIGKGFLRDIRTNLIKEYSTEAIGMVFEANANAAYGFYIKSAFPNIEDYDLTKPTHNDITPFMKKTQTYQNGSPTKKAYLEYSSDPQATAEVHLHERQYDSFIVMEQPSENPNILYKTYFNACSQWTSTVDKEFRQPSEERINLSVPENMQMFKARAPIAAKQIERLHTILTPYMHPNSKRPLPSFCHQEQTFNDEISF